MRTLPAADVVADTKTGIVLATATAPLVSCERKQSQQRAAAAGAVCAGFGFIGDWRTL
jgi:hypothetical protein